MPRDSAIFYTNQISAGNQNYFVSLRATCAGEYNPKCEHMLPPTLRMNRRDFSQVYPQWLLGARDVSWQKDVGLRPNKDLCIGLRIGENENNKFENKANSLTILGISSVPIIVALARNGPGEVYRNV